MSAARQPLAPDARLLTPFNFNPNLPISQPCDECSISSKGAGISGQAHYDAACRIYIMRHSIDTFSWAYISRPTNFDAKIDQQADLYAIKKLSGGWVSVSLKRYNVQVDLLVPQVSIEKGLKASRNARPSKRQWELESDLATQDDRTKSPDNAQCLKKAKVDCDCGTDHSWRMTIKIEDLNKALRRINVAMGLVGRLAYNLEDLDKIAVGNIINLLEDSEGILKSAKDDMIEGGIDRGS